MPVFQLADEEIFFPPAFLAEEDGLVAVGGDLSPTRLLTAYSCGIFPWYIERGMPFWFSPDPRMLLYVNELRVSKSLQTFMRKRLFRVSFNEAFEAVIRQCATVPRQVGNSTWIDEAFLTGYTALHRMGYAHSVEVWQGDELVGGLYGVGMGRYFCGESMFSKTSNASKVALVALVERLRTLNVPFVDCQVHSPHLESMGGEEVPRQLFLEALVEVVGKEPGKLEL